MSGSEMFDQANNLHMAGEYEKAEELYDQLLTQNHDNAGLLATMGTMYLSMKKPGLAMALLHASLDKSKVKPPDVLTNLGLAYKYSGQYEKALGYMKKAIKDKAASPEAFATYAAMFVEVGNPNEVIRHCKKALEEAPKLALAHWNMSLALLEQGKWETAWDEYDWGMLSGMRADRKLYDIPMWDGTKGKKVWVWGEQGIGDEIMFASMIPDMLADGVEVVFECHERLKTLFEKSFPTIKVYGTRDEKEITWVSDEKPDARISIGSLGKFYRRSKESFPGTPYLKADPLEKGNKFRIGISWTGGLKAGRVKKRTVPLSWWKDILHMEGRDVEFVSLQYTNCEEEIKFVNGLGYDIKEFPEAKAHDYYETARLVASCDLVITVCTSIVYVAGGLGIPTWVMTPHAAAWRYQNSGPMPWYRSVRLYRQPEGDPGAWIPVISKVAYDLAQLCNERQKEAA